MKDALGAVHVPEWGGVGARVPAPQPAHGRGPPWSGGRLGGVRHAGTWRHLKIRAGPGLCNDLRQWAINLKKAIF